MEDMYILSMVGFYKNHNYFLKISKNEKEEANGRRKKFRSLRNLFLPKYIGHSSSVRITECFQGVIASRKYPFNSIENNQTLEFKNVRFCLDLTFLKFAFVRKLKFGTRIKKMVSNVSRALNLF